MNIKELEPFIEKFSLWLNERGAEVLLTTNEYEVVRFRTQRGVSVIYKRKDGTITFTFESQTAWKAYRKGGSWRAKPATKRKSTNEIATIRARDGDLCFYCLEHVNSEDETEEHLVSLTHGGPHHISNKFLAHSECNQIAGNLSATEKINIHVSAILRKASEKVKGFYAEAKQ